MISNFRLRHGLMWRWSYIPLRRTPRIRDFIVAGALILSASFLWASWHLNDENEQLVNSNAALVEMLHIREEQLLSCLNGKAVGWYATRTEQVYVVCRPAEEYPIKGI